MTRPNFRTINCDDFTMSKIQDNVASTFNSILSQPDMPKVLLRDVVIFPTRTPILHNLGAIPNGYIVVRLDGPAIIYEVWPDGLPHGDSVTAIPLSASSIQYLYLASSIAVTATLLVF